MALRSKRGTFLSDKDADQAVNSANFIDPSENELRLALGKKVIDKHLETVYRPTTRRANPGEFTTPEQLIKRTIGLMHNEMTRLEEAVKQGPLTSWEMKQLNEMAANLIRLNKEWRDGNMQTQQERDLSPEEIDALLIKVMYERKLIKADENGRFVLTKDKVGNG